MKEFGAVVPFYTKQENIEEDLVKLQKTIDEIAQTQVDIIGVVNDSTLSILDKIKMGSKDFVLNLEKNVGKEDAIKKGLQYFIETYPDIRFFIQSDFDLEQNPKDSQLFIDFVNEFDLNNTDSLLLIGDRYSKNGGNNIYRKNILHIQSLLSKVFGNDIQDITSGLRAYSKSFVENFLNIGLGSGFASDLDQYIVGYLTNTIMLPIPLTNAMPRSMYTNGDKLIEVFKGLLIHKKALCNMGKENIVQVFESIVSGLEKHENIVIDLSTIGISEKYLYKNIGNNKYTLEIL